MLSSLWYDNVIFRCGFFRPLGKSFIWFRLPHWVRSLFWDWAPLRRSQWSWEPLTKHFNKSIALWLHCKELVILLMSILQRTMRSVIVNPPLSSWSQPGTRPPVAPELSFNFQTDYTSSATLHSSLDLNLSLSVWWHVLHKWHVRIQAYETIYFVLGYPISGCSDVFQTKRPRTGAGAAVSDDWDLPWESHKVIMALWPRSVGIARVNGVFLLMDIFELSGVWKEKIGNLNTGKAAFH